MLRTADPKEDNGDELELMMLPFIKVTSTFISHLTIYHNAFLFLFLIIILSTPQYNTQLILYLFILPPIYLHPRRIRCVEARHGSRE